MNPHEIYSVSALNLETKALLSTHFGVIYVSGEISNLSRPSSGHLYFSLKDQQSQIKCALFRFQNQKIPFEMENGQAVIVKAQVSLYEARGDYQLIVSSVELAGAGQLQIEFEKLKNKLSMAGLFDEAHKKTLPTLPKQIGIITSPSAAALHDILKVLKKRFPSIPILIYPAMVQGEMAANQIINAIKTANHRKECDILILARGGGSLEDLWCFNNEKLAHAIFESTIPIITGIGHQTDFTIADFVADCRAPTPSAAAEMVTPDCVDILNQLSKQQKSLEQIIGSKINILKAHLMHLRKRLKHPAEKLKEYAQKLDLSEMNLKKIMERILCNHRKSISHYAELLDNLSPLRILQRGFSVTRKKGSKDVLTSVKQVSPGDRIVTQLSDGEIESVV